MAAPARHGFVASIVLPVAVDRVALQTESRQKLSPQLGDGPNA
jgi:hypothetical protein